MHYHTHTRTAIPPPSTLTYSHPRKALYPLTYCRDPWCEGVSPMNQQRASLHPTWGEAGTTWVDRGTILWGVVCWVRINDQTFTAKLLGQLCLEEDSTQQCGTNMTRTWKERKQSGYKYTVKHTSPGFRATTDKNQKTMTYCSLVWFKCLSFRRPSQNDASCLTLTSWILKPASDCNHQCVPAASLVPGLLVGG